MAKWELTKWEVDEVVIDEMGIDKVGIDKVGIDQLGIDKVGIDKVGINPCNHGESLQRVCTATDGMLFWFCLLWFAASASSGSFQTLFSRLISWQLVRFLIYLKDKLVLQAQPFLFPLQDQWHI